MGNRRVTTYALLLVILLFLISLYYKFSGNYDGENYEKIIRENINLKLKLKELQDQLEICRKDATKNLEPSLIYEMKRRKIRSTVQYMWDAVKFHIENQFSTSNCSADLKEVLHIIYEHKISILRDWKQLSLNDGYESWRQAEVEILSNLVQKKIHKTQHPSSCKNAKFLICKSDGTLCGWGCQTEKYAQCLAFALGLNRVLIFEKDPDSYYERDEYQKYYEPITSCAKPGGIPIVPWTGSNEPQIITAGVLRLIVPHIKYLFSSVPKSLSKRLEKLFDDPSVWWVAEVEKYLLKLNINTQNIINETMEKIGFKKPIVGVHVRRTDKVGIPIHNIEEYMSAVDEYYDILELSGQVVSRRIFLCTDEPQIIQNITTKYSNYEVIVNEENSQLANNLNARYKNSIGIMKDEFLLAECDYLVGTLSSNVLRRAYEFLYWRYADAQEKVKSLDYRHLIVGENPPLYKVIIAHRARSQEELETTVGQILEVVSNFDMRGVTMLKNRDTLKQGLVPSLKIEKVTETVKFPDFQLN